MSDVSQLIELLSQQQKMVAMVAPSFPIMYQPSEIVSKLKKLGFAAVVEVSVGAKKTNEQVMSVLQTQPTARFITSPCASFVRLVRKKYPHLVQYLAFQADSPMIATARIITEKYPDHKPVFIGPCIVKKLEATEDYPDLNILVLTYKELEEVLAHYQVPAECNDPAAVFDLAEASTRIYPTDGGLTETSGLRSVLKDEEIRIVSGWEKCEATLKEFEQNPTIRFVDILFCDGGCINGPGIVSTLSREEREQRIKDYSLSGFSVEQVVQ